MEVAMAEPGEILPERLVNMEALYNMLTQSKASAQEIVAKMLAIKKEAEPKSQLQELVTQILINFVTLRQANRSILLEEDRVKVETERAKTPVDFTTLQLHNLMYEKNHYVKAIKACKDFKTKYTDIELVPEEEFSRDAPEEIKSSVLSTDSSHDLMLKRLNYELFQRKELCKLRDKLELQKRSLQETMTNRKKFLTSLPSHLKALKKASLPVQNQLGVLHTRKLKQQQLAELLPPALYVIFSQLLAQKEAFGENIELEIMGSLKEAHAFARQLANKDPGLSTNTENSKLDDDGPDEDDDGQRRRKRPRKVPTKENLDQSGIYQSHPLKVTVHINDNAASDLDPKKLITLKFEFLIKLNVVFVGLEGSGEVTENDILCNLFPDDTGLELPQQSAKLCVGNSISFDKGRTSRPYKWVQHLAGIDFLPEMSPLVSVSDDSNRETRYTSVLSGLSLYRQQNRVQTIVQRLRARKKAQISLAEILDSLNKISWPTITCDNVPWTSHTPCCNFHSWFVSTSKNTKPSPVSEIEHAPASINADRKSGMSKEELETTTEDGELPALIPLAGSVDDINLTPSRKGTELENSRMLTLMSKNIITPMSKGKSPSFKKLEDDIDLMFESENELDEPVQVVETTSDDASALGLAVVQNLWAECGIQEYSLVLIRKLDNGERNIKLEAKVNLSVEYPIRPPYFKLSLYSSVSGENYLEANCSEWYNELRAMEAEVNVHIIRMIPFSQENLILGHQVLCLTMLFDFLFDDDELSSEKRNTSVIDIGLCRPVSGALITRSFRGRDHRKMISWKGDNCTPGYPH